MRISRLHKINTERGFTLTEIALVVSLIGIAFVVISAGCINTGGKVPSAELKANCHTIQIALERYRTDNNEYPAYLLGGDIPGWEAWHDKWDRVNNIDMVNDRVASNDVVHDPLIEYDYITSYPHNPFTDNPRVVIRATSTDGSNRDGDGDPRFGMTGIVMGQGLDDMNLFRGANHPGPYFWSQVETRRTLDHGDWMNVPEEFKDYAPFETDMYYLFGGFRERHGSDPIYTYWPGNFFYKAASDQEFPRGMVFVPNTNMGGHYNRYILGGYGAENTEGMDVIRLVPYNPDGERLSWQCGYEGGDEMCFELGYELFDEGFGEPGGLPEVFGGGDERHGPWWPYNSDPENPGEFIYGAPDGVPDGVIIVLTNGSEIEQFRRWQ